MTLRGFELHYRKTTAGQMEVRELRRLGTTVLIPGPLEPLLRVCLPRVPLKAHDSWEPGLEYGSITSPAGSRTW